MKMKENPVINSDFPDPDIIRVGGTYYMASTTMHYMPGCDILRSFDLLNWEFVSHAYKILCENREHGLEDEEQIYGKGMWAPSLRYHKGMYYITFTSNDLHKTFLLKASDPTGPWEKGEIEGFFYDNGLFFDEDDRVYIVHGQGIIRITELEKDLSRARSGGLDRVLLEDERGIPLGYEGSHLYKKDGKYYLFNCHFNGKGNGRKTQDCHVADSLHGSFTGGCMIDADDGYRNLGIAQGGIIDTPRGEWYAFMFQDRGALGRAPYLIPIHFENDFPVIGRAGENGRIPQCLSVESTRPDYQYQPLNGSDDFIYEKHPDGKVELKPFWQFSHNPHPDYWSVTARKGAFRLISDKISPNLVLSHNTLTQRCYGFSSEAWVTVDGRAMKDGDYAGISTYMGCYGAIALTKNEGKYELVMLGKTAVDETIFGQFDYEVPGVEYERLSISGPVVRIKAATDFQSNTDEGIYAYDVNSISENAGEEERDPDWRMLGIRQQLYFKMDFFTGCRFGLFYFSTKETGGQVDFMKFRYHQ